MTFRLEGAGARRDADVIVDWDANDAADDGDEEEEEEEKLLPFLLLAAAPFLPPLPPPFPPLPLPLSLPTLTTTFALSTAGTRCSACAERTLVSS